MNNRKARQTFFKNFSTFTKKLALSTLAFSLIFGSAPFAFAQEIPQEIPVPTQESTTEVSTPVESTSIQTDAEAKDEQVVPIPEITPEPDPEDADDNTGNTSKGDLSFQAQSLAGVGDPTVSQPVGQSQIKQTIPDTDPSTGALVYSYPITVPPGRGSMTPDLKLTYNSQDSKEWSYFGDKWTLNIPYIERMNKTGSDNLYTANYFSSSIDGELVLVSGTTYAPKVENGSFNKYTYNGTTWTITDKNGVVYKYGAQAGTRQDDPSDSTHIFRWMLEEARDTNNNYITYGYYKDAGQIYPDTITYTGNNVTAGIFTVVFNREAYDTVNSVSPYGFYPNFKVTTNYRINTITTNISGSWVHKYDLTYTTGDQGYRRVLSSIVESGRDEAGTVTTLPAATFAYKAHGTMGWDTASTWQLPRQLREKSGESTFLQIQDINGDTYPDVFYNERSFGEAAYTSNTIDGWNADDGNWTVPTWIKNTVGFKDDGTRFFDINGDLLPDIVKSFSTSSGLGTPSATSTYINSGDPATGWVSNGTITAPIAFVFGTGTLADNGVRSIDVNGDGIADLVRSYLDDDGSGLIQGVYLGTGSGWTAANWWNMAGTIPNH
jgi:hypothetical protein